MGENGQNNMELLQGLTESAVQSLIQEHPQKEIAQATGGLYFRATNNKKLQEIYREINKLEKTEIEEFKYYNYQEKFRPLVILALGLFLIELLLRLTVFRSFIQEWQEV